MSHVSRPRVCAVLFDLGNTLAAYYHPSEFRPILAEAIGAVRDELTRRGRCPVSEASVIAAAALENREATDYRVTPMTERFERIFQVSFADDPSLAATTCERFMAPIFALGRVYENVLPTLAAPECRRSHRVAALAVVLRWRSATSQECGATLEEPAN